MSAEFGEGGVVQLPVQRHVVLDLLAGVQAVQDVTLQVRIDGVALVQTVQRDPVERQRPSDVLTEKERGEGFKCCVVSHTNYMPVCSNSRQARLTCG